MTFEDILKTLRNTSPVETEDEYWKTHKLFKKGINQMTFNVKKLIGNPKNYIESFEEFLDEGVRIGIISDEFKEQQMKRLMKELNSPSEFKEWLKVRINKVKDKLKK